MITQAGSMEVRRDPASGLITSKKLFNTEVKYFYDSTYGELQKISYFYLGKDIYTRQFKRDLLGRIIEENDGQPKSIFYDRAGRLLGRSDKASGKPFSSYQYDKNGNRILSEENGTVQSATYDDQDRLLSFGANTYSYDANGNISSKVDGSLTLTQYIYDSDGTLAAVNMPGKMIWFGTDNEGRRIEKKVNGVKVENYIWDGLLRLVAVTNSSGVIQKRFIYSDGHAPDYMVDAQGATYLFITDHRGSVLSVINSNTGQVVQSLRYTEWGAVISDSNPGFQPFGFAGGLYDRDTKLLRFGARNYDPEVGRWTSKDPIGFSGGMTNLYGYSFDDPVNFIDVNGKNPCVAGSIITDAFRIHELGVRIFNLEMDLEKLLKGDICDINKAQKVDAIQRQLSELRKLRLNIFENGFKSGIEKCFPGTLNPALGNVGEI